MFTRREWAVIQRNRTPRQVQTFLNRIPYNWEKKGETLRSFRQVLRHGSAHCLEAALSAAVLLEQHGFLPLLLDLESKDNLDHVLFLFRQKGRWGAIARSREPGLHGRKPVFRTVRDLVMSYVEPYVDSTGRVTGYGVTDLRNLLPKYDWRFSSRNMWAVQNKLIKMPHKRIATSTKRYKVALRRFIAFRKKFPHKEPIYYRNRHQWMY